MDAAAQVDNNEPGVCLDAPVTELRGIPTRRVSDGAAAAVWAAGRAAKPRRAPGRNPMGPDRGRITYRLPQPRGFLAHSIPNSRGGAKGANPLLHPHEKQNR